MIQVKIFSNALKKDLEQAINDWIKENSSIIVFDIKYTVSNYYNAMIVYEI